MKKYDVAIIGGGLTGCATAYYLSKSGSRVAVIERGQINQGASGQNAGSLHFQLEHRFLEQKDQLKKEMEDFVALTLIAVDHWKNIERELDCDLQLVMDGGFMIAETTEDIKTLQEKSEIELSQGLTVEMLDGNEVRKIAPYLSSNVKAALHCPYEGHCNPRLLTPAYARNAEASGAEIFTNAEVTGIRLQDRKWELSYCSDYEQGPHEKISADAVINTAGVWAREIAMMVNVELPLIPIGLILNVTEKIPLVINHLIQHAGRRLSMKQVADGNLLIGGGWLAELQKRDGKWLSKTSALINTDSIRQNLRVATDLVPLVNDLNLIRSWTGITTLTPDELPILGELPGSPGFYLAVGGNGFTLGPTYAQLMSELILTGNTSFPLAPFGPERFL
jgi:glycine/D-amino acid oxidase-like deaminating enzyme